MPTPNQTITGIPSGYVPQEYPKAVYDKDGKTRLVQNPAQLEDLLSAGYTEKYTAPKAAVAVTAQGTTGTEVAGLKQTVASLTKEVTAGLQKFNDLNAKFVDAVAELEKFKAAVAANKPAAPPAPPAPPAAPVQEAKPVVPPVGKQAIKQ